jgi:predicted ABC-type ATPase
MIMTRRIWNLHRSNICGLPESAGQQPIHYADFMVMLRELERHFSARVSFAFETTLSGRSYLRQIREWQKAGYRVKLIFLQLGSAEEAIARVAQRVRQGGHHIPEDVIRRRFTAGKANLEKLYAPLVDAWARYDNSGTEPVLIQWNERA